MFEWMKGNIDGKSVIISSKHGSIELKPITASFLEKIPEIVDVSDEEEEAINNLRENVENLLSAGYDLLYCETYEAAYDLFDHMKVRDEILDVEIKSAKPYKFKFYADDQLTLASYSMAFQIALGIGEIKDVSYYYKRTKVTDLEKHDKNKMLLTVITLDDGQQMVLCPVDDGVDIMIGKMKILKKYILFTYDDGETVIDWTYDELYHTYDIYETTLYEMWSQYEWNKYYSKEDDEEEDDYDEDEDDGEDEGEEDE